jgi:hypothetical protein
MSDLTVSVVAENVLAYYKILLCTDSPRFTFILYIQYESIIINKKKTGYLSLQTKLKSPYRKKEKENAPVNRNPNKIIR